MIKRLGMLCGVLALFLYGQTPPTHEMEERHGCGPVGNSGALVCRDGVLDIVPAVVPRVSAANRFTGLNTFAQGILMDTREQRRLECKEETRGAIWFKRDEQRDGVQVCVRDGGRYRWASLDLQAERE